MYDMLSDDPKVDKDVFEERYANIYEGIEDRIFH
ncbi:hypothetical protein SD457_04275 [Coprobacillaceae bacterium CR2/5/TPMF4]|nr:hypothetical protein SD457_04275 [Coprobacillaceae bacterium CR2/5/TPMF4]